MTKPKTKQVVNMNYPTTLLNRIDDYMEKTGFVTRTQTIIHLLQIALDKESKHSD